MWLSGSPALCRSATSASITGIAEIDEVRTAHPLVRSRACRKISERVMGTSEPTLRSRASRNQGEEAALVAERPATWSAGRPCYQAHDLRDMLPGLIGTKERLGWNDPSATPKAGLFGLRRGSAESAATARQMASMLGIVGWTLWIITPPGARSPSSPAQPSALASPVWPRPACPRSPGRGGAPPGGRPRGPRRTPSPRLGPG